MTESVGLLTGRSEFFQVYRKRNRREGNCLLRSGLGTAAWLGVFRDRVDRSFVVRRLL
jgi:hypothetical protein